MQKYRVLSVIGSGAYSQVFKAVEVGTGKMVAIKQMQLSQTNMAINRIMMREARNLSEMGSHPNVVKMIECFKHKGSLCLVLEHMPMDLITFYKALQDKEKRKLSHSEIKFIFKQICQAVSFLHSKNIMHRDIKPQNILIDPSTLRIKIIDFGFAKTFQNQNNTDYMITRWYRPLEVVLGLPYNHKVDVFSLGALLLELYNQRQVFRSASNADQIYWIVNVCGYPYWPPAVQKLQKLGITVNKTQSNLRKLMIGVPQDAKDLIQKMLKVIPYKRISIFEALDHSFFVDQLKESKIETPVSNSSTVPGDSPIVRSKHYSHTSNHQIKIQKRPSYHKFQTSIHKRSNSNERSMKLEMLQKTFKLQKAQVSLKQCGNDEYEKPKRSQKQMDSQQRVPQRGSIYALKSLLGVKKGYEETVNPLVKKQLPSANYLSKRMEQTNLAERVSEQKRGFRNFHQSGDVKQKKIIQDKLLKRNESYSQGFGFNLQSNRLKNNYLTRKNTVLSRDHSNTSSKDKYKNQFQKIRNTSREYEKSFKMPTVTKTSIDRCYKQGTRGELRSYSNSKISLDSNLVSHNGSLTKNNVEKSFQKDKRNSFYSSAVNIIQKSTSKKDLNILNTSMKSLRDIDKDCSMFNRVKNIINRDHHQETRHVVNRVDTGGNNYFLGQNIRRNVLANKSRV